MGSPERMSDVCKLICKDGQKVLVVLSAMSGTTNSLIEITKCYAAGDQAGADALITKMHTLYTQHVSNLYSAGSIKNRVQEFIDDKFEYLRSFGGKAFTEKEEKEIIAQGELMSTFMLATRMNENGVNTALLPALEFMRTREDGEPDMDYIRASASRFVDPDNDIQVYITQGFICRDSKGLVSNLQRGGSDYSASILGAVLNAEEIQIWTDIDGIHNNDPRIVDKTQPIRKLSFDEAAELAYFGAKILHPTCVLPARMAGIPVRLLNTMDPDAPGTLISEETEPGRIKAVAAKDGITAINVKSSRMLLAYGFLRKVFEIFESYKTPIDMIVTSEVGVSMSIDNDANLDAIVADLEKYGTVQVERNMCVICVVGDMKWNNVGFESRALDALSEIPVHMISYGGSSNNISFLIGEDDKKRALQRLSDHLFKGRK